MLEKSGNFELIVLTVFSHLNPIWARNANFLPGGEAAPIGTEVKGGGRPEQKLEGENDFQQ